VSPRPRWLAVAAGALALAAAACRRPRPPDGACLALRAPEAPVGFGAGLAITAAPSCPGVPRGRVDWRQVGGPPLAELATDGDGFRLRARMPALADALGGPAPWGVVPLAPRTRGEVTLEASWSDGRGHALAPPRRVVVAAAARSRGLPNTPIGARVYLGGGGWRLGARPDGSGAGLESDGGAASLLPDVPGDFELSDGAGRALTLRAGRYDETPLDCGRAGCHAAIADAAAASPMTTVLARGIAPAAHGPSFGPAYPGCAIACHATGEPGVADGGFTHVANEIGVADLAGRDWASLPRALRRVGGVGCLACHGPGALPAESGRWSILRADVCAVCHDAPPRYGHVAAWRARGMARADGDERARGDEACARCHTTWGFLAALAPTSEPGGGAGARPVDRRPPGEVGPVGITCAACHAVHDPGHGGGERLPAAPAPALLRVPPEPALLTLAGAPATPPASASSRVCLPCHAPSPGEARPSSSAAALWLGRGGVDPSSGRPLAGPAPHAAVGGGCVGCHRGGPAAVERGAAHGFQAPAATCAPCHARAAPPPASDVRERARRLWDAWRARAAGEEDPHRPPHASGTAADRATPLGRAVWDVLLVLEDPAAGAHNAPYARALLAAAEPLLAPATAPAPVKRGGRP
jgi:hypothetical protein